MNDKTAKALRKIARQSDLPAETTYLRHRKNGNRVVHPNSQRGLYRAMKKHIANGGHDEA